MTFQFDDAAITGVLRHMNHDHTDDSLLIVRAFGAPDATAAQMTGLDGDGGRWSATTPSGERTVDVAWPGGPIDERPAVRRAVVALYDAACVRLGVQPRAHD